MVRGTSSYWEFDDHSPLLPVLFLTLFPALLEFVVVLAETGSSSYTLKFSQIWGRYANMKTFPSRVSNVSVLQGPLPGTINLASRKSRVKNARGGKFFFFFFCLHFITGATRQPRRQTSSSWTDKNVDGTLQQSPSP